VRNRLAVAARSAAFDHDARAAVIVAGPRHVVATGWIGFSTLESEDALTRLDADRTDRVGFILVAGATFDLAQVAFAA
jgi:hypothetical protein